MYVIIKLDESGDNMKDFFKILFMVLIVVTVFCFRNDIANFITEDIIYKGSNKVLTYNEYYLDYDYLYVQNTDNNHVKTYQEILNIFYTTINSGDDSFSFYCDYKGCMDDVNKVINDEHIISNINNFVHPYNSYSSINIDINNAGKVTIKSKKTYTNEQIDYINNYIDEFINKNINDGMDNLTKIKLFHDYVINNTVYDEDNSNKIYNAYYLITTNKAICGGYSDIMSIYLNKLGIQNYKITSLNHVWNLVKVNDRWYHIDVTWDDPVASDGKQYLIHNFFMISTKELLELDKVEHNFDANVYQEAN